MAITTTSNLDTLWPSMSGISTKTIGKMRNTSLDNWPALHQQQTLYAHPPHSACSTSGSLPSALASPSSMVASSKKAASSSASVCIKNELQAKLSEFTWESEGSMDNEDDQHTCCLVTCLNYTIHNQELNLLIATRSIIWTRTFNSNMLRKVALTSRCKCYSFRSNWKRYDGNHHPHHDLVSSLLLEFSSEYCSPLSCHLCPSANSFLPSLTVVIPPPLLG